MDDLLKLIISVLSTIIVAGESTAVAYINSWKRRFDKEKKEKIEYKNKKEEKDLQIQHLHNGFRDEVYSRLGNSEKTQETLKSNLETLEKNQEKMLSIVTKIEERERISLIVGKIQK